MSMELEGDDGATRIPISPASKNTEVGRGAGVVSSDRTVSRRHVSFQLPASNQDNPEGTPAQGAEASTVSFEVVGKNPVLVVTREGKRIFRRSERGEMGTGDRISLSLRNPFFFSLKGNGGGCEVDKGVLDAVQRRENRTAQRRKEKEEEQEMEIERARVSSGKEEEERGDARGPDLKSQTTDLSQIDPVKEFGFLVRGHEFDHYPRKIRDVKSWNWFLREHRDSSDEDQDPDEPRMARRVSRKKKRKGEDNVDEDWTGESEDEKVVAASSASARRPKYLTRSEDQRKPKPTSPGEETVQRKGFSNRKRRFEEDDEEDETLGGFIVKNGEEEKEEQEEEDDDDEEEEEFDDEEDDD